jgi:hypothetical protein
MLKTVTMKERMVDEDIPAEPVGEPSPTAPSPTASAAKIETEIYAGIPTQAHIDARIKQRRVITPVRWSPHIRGIKSG